MKYIIGIAVSTTLALIFYFQTDRVYLKRKTIKILNTVSSSASPLPQITLAKINEIAKYMHFSIQYEVNFNHRLYQDHSLSQLRGALFAYFQAGNAARIQHPKDEEIYIVFSTEDSHKVAEMSFPVKINWQAQEFLCRVQIDWKKQSSWQAHKIKMFNCLSGLALSNY